MHDSIEYLNVKRPGVNYCFTMDNLSIHKNPIITALVENAGHCVVYCAPYWLCDGAIEYVFNTIHTKLQMPNDLTGATTLDDLRDKLDDIIIHMRLRLLDHILHMLVSHNNLTLLSMHIILYIIHCLNPSSADLLDTTTNIVN